MNKDKNKNQISLINSLEMLKKETESFITKLHRSLVGVSICLKIKKWRKIGKFKLIIFHTYITSRKDYLEICFVYPI